METLGAIPETVAEIERRFENFYSDETLAGLIDNLYIAVLKAIEAMLQWLFNKPGR